MSSTKYNFKKVKEYIWRDKPFFISITFLIFFLIFAYIYVYNVDKRSDIEKCADTKYAFDHSTEYSKLMLSKNFTLSESAKTLLEELKKTSFKYKANNRYMYWFEICEKEKVLAPITFSKQWRGSIWY